MQSIRNLPHDGHSFAGRGRRAHGRRCATLRAGLAACLAAALTLGWSDGASAQRTLQALLRDTVLENGLRVIVLPNPAVPLATVQVTVRNGAFTQVTEPEVGVPHILEHMLFRGFGTDGFSEHAGRINASYNGMTSDEAVAYYVTLPSSNLDRGIRLMADLMSTPRFDRTALEAELRVVRGELERSGASPDFVLSSTVNQRLWGDAWGRKNAIGNMLTIMGATPDVLMRTYRRFYVPNNAAVVITGDVDAPTAFALAARHFGRWKPGPDPFAELVLPPMPELRGNQQVVVPLEANDVTLLIRWQGPSVGDDAAGAYAADLFAALVNDRVSDLQERLVDSGLFQSVSMSYLSRAHVGPISIRATTTAEQLVEASAALRAEVSRFTEPGYITPELLAVARRRQEVEWAMHMETPSTLAWFIGELWSVAGGLDFVRGYLDAIMATDAAELQRFAATYLTRPRVTGVLLSPRTRHELGGRLQTALADWR